MHYWWEPEVLVSSQRSSRFIVPDYSQECGSLIQPDPKYSGVDCDQEPFNLYKVMNKNVSKHEPDLFELWSKFIITNKDQMNMMRSVHSNFGGTGNMSISEAACNWLKTTTVDWPSWIRINEGDKEPGQMQHSISDEMHNNSKNEKLILILLSIGAALMTSAFILQVLFHLRSAKKNALKLRAPPDVGSTGYFLFTDIQDSTALWEKNRTDMYEAIQLHHNCIRTLLQKYHGYETGTQGDSFLCVFRNADDALHFAHALQIRLLHLDWPAHLKENITELMAPRKQEVAKAEAAVKFLQLDSNLQHPERVSEDWPPAMQGKRVRSKMWNGLRVRVAIHCGEVTTSEEISGRMVFFGTTVDHTKQILDAVVSGGQVVCSANVLSMASQAALVDLCLLHLGSWEMQDPVQEMELVSLSPKNLACRQCQFLPLKKIKQLTPAAHQCPKAREDTTLVFCSLVDLKLMEMQLVSVLKMAPRDQRFPFRSIRSSLISTADLKNVKTHVLPLFQEVTEGLIQEHGGYIAETRPGFYLVAFHTPTAAISWATNTQAALMNATWPPVVLLLNSCCERLSSECERMFRGPRVKMGIAWGDLQAVSLHSASGRSAYYGPTVNLAARVEGLAVGGQVLVAASADQDAITSVKTMIDTHVPNATSIDLGAFHMKGIADLKQVLQVQLQELSHRSFHRLSKDGGKRLSSLHSISSGGVAMVEDNNKSNSNVDSSRARITRNSI